MFSALAPNNGHGSIWSACPFGATSGLMHRSNFAVEEPHLRALRAAHGPFSGNGRPAAWVAADIVRIEDGKLAEHWDVPQDEATKAQSVSGLPMFGDRFPD